MIKKHILTLSLILATVVGFAQTPYKLNYPDITIGNRPDGGKIVLNGSNLQMPRIGDGSVTDSVLTIVNGVIKKVPRSQFSGGGSSGVTSFNNRNGNVIPQPSDYSSFYYPISSNPAGYLTSAPVNSVNGRTGSVTGLAESSSLNNYIPYVGATQNINIGQNTLKIGSNIGYGKISIAGNYTEMDSHGFDDYSILTPSLSGLGYGIFDASTEMKGSTNNDHFISYQARQKYLSSGSMLGGYGLTGYFYQPTHEGAGLIANARGLYILNVLGSGPISNDIGIEISDRSRGSSSNVAIKTGLGKVNLGDQTNIVGNIANDAILGINNTNILGYGAYIKGGNSNNFSLRVDDYIGNTLMELKTNNINFTGDTKVNGKLKVSSTPIDSIDVVRLKDLSEFDLQESTNAGGKTSNAIQITGASTPESLSKGLTLFYDGGNERSVITSYDAINNVPKNMAINPDGGNIAIGKTSALAMIDINGSARASSNDGNANTLVRNIDIGYSGGNINISGNIKNTPLVGTGDRPVFAAADGTLKIGTIVGTDDLQSVTARGSTTNQAITVNNTLQTSGTLMVGSSTGNNMFFDNSGTGYMSFSARNNGAGQGMNWNAAEFFFNGKMSFPSGLLEYPSFASGNFVLNNARTAGLTVLQNNGVSKFEISSTLNKSNQTFSSVATGSTNAITATSTSGVGVLSNSTSGISVSSIALTGKAGRFETSSGTGVTLDVVNSGTGDILNGSNSGGIKYRVTNAGGSVAADDVEITTATKGVILRAPDGGRWRITVSNTGVLSTTSIP